MTSLTRNQIMVQAGTAMLAQANSTSQSVLTLLRG
jgi:flagellin